MESASKSVVGKYTNSVVSMRFTPDLMSLCSRVHIQTTLEKSVQIKFLIKLFTNPDLRLLILVAQAAELSIWKVEQILKYKCGF